VPLLGHLIQPGLGLVKLTNPCRSFSITHVIAVSRQPSDSDFARLVVRQATLHSQPSSTDTMFPGGQDPFAQMFGMMNQMNGMMSQMNQMFQDPFFGMPPAVRGAPDHRFMTQHCCSAVPWHATDVNLVYLQQAPPQAYQQLPQTAPRVEEVPHDAPAGRGAGAAAAGPIVEEPEGRQLCGSANSTTMLSSFLYCPFLYIP
jgi:hypothetical protein